MKIKKLLMISPAVLAMAVPLFAEDSSPAPGAQKPGHEARGDRPGKGGPADISPADREKLRAAHQKAMEDPKVKEAEKTFQKAQKAFHDAMKAAMLAADPTIGPLLEKMPMMRGEGGPGRWGGPGGEGRHHRDGDKKGPSAEASASPSPK